MSPKEAAACCRPVDDRLDPEIFKVLADPTRAELFGCLVKCGRACTVTEVAECCAVDFSVVSRHLQVLERGGLVESERAGRSVSYHVRYEHVCGVLRALADAIEHCAPAGGACCGKR